MSLSFPSPSFLTSLEPHQVVIFGSNSVGHHGGGAAGYFFRGNPSPQYGDLRGVVGNYCVGGVAKGFQQGKLGCSYAIVTKDAHYQSNGRVKIGGQRSIPLNQIEVQIVEFLKFARSHSDKEFLVTEFGTRMAGYSTQEIGALWVGKEIPSNVRLPQSFINVVRQVDPTYVEVEVVAEPTTVTQPALSQVSDRLWALKLDESNTPIRFSLSSDNLSLTTTIDADKPQLIAAVESYLDQQGVNYIKEPQQFVTWFMVDAELLKHSNQLQPKRVMQEVMPPVSMTIASLYDAEQLLTNPAPGSGQSKPTHVISIGMPDEPPPKGLEQLPHLRLEFADTHDSTHCLPPQRHHIEQAIAFGREVQAAKGHLLVHCQMGISRSSGIALAILADQMQEYSPKDVLQHLDGIKENILPNALIVRWTDELVGGNFANWLAYAKDLPLPNPQLEEPTPSIATPKATLIAAPPSSHTTETSAPHLKTIRYSFLVELGLSLPTEPIQAMVNRAVQRTVELGYDAAQFHVQDKNSPIGTAIQTAIQQTEIPPGLTIQLVDQQNASDHPHQRNANDLMLAINTGRDAKTQAILTTTKQIGIQVVDYNPLTQKYTNYLNPSSKAKTSERSR